jgi:hypothetical protein
LVANAALSQKLNGLWYGRAEANTAGSVNSYLCEITLKKNNKGFSGMLNYYFGPDAFNTPITAKYWPATKTIELDPFPLITYFATDKNAPDCMMDGSLTLYVDGADSVLYGQLNPVGKYRNSCPIMTVHLRREGATVKTYMEREKAGEPVADTLVIWEEETALVVSEPARKSADSLLIQPILPPAETEIQTSVEALTGRNFVQGAFIEVETDSIRLYLYDNGRVDNDTISVFLNRRPVVLNQGLSVKPIILPIRLAPGENEISLFAVNLGDIPPNTALCIIYAGNKRYDINLSSTLAVNGTIRVRKKETRPLASD